ncbi:trypco2 family protein [Streptomyces sp. NPDC057456]|uniref:trypco2 family protein n=1 Tax=Streptomyces sp. NPDC057456 TaxID=3346139 RepID=UPI0036A40F34
MQIPLAEALAELRRELYAAQVEGASEQFRFEVEQVELSLEIDFRRDADGKIKVEVGIPGTKISGEAGAGLSGARRQVLVLTLQARDEARGGNRVRIRREAESELAHLPMFGETVSAPQPQDGALNSGNGADADAPHPWNS